MTFDGKAFGAEIVGIVKGHVERALAPISARIDAMEKAISSMPVPKDGKSIALDDVAPMIKSEVDRIGASILDAAKASVAELVAAIPPAANGKDADVAAIVEEVTGTVVEGIKELLPDPVSKPQVADMISRALADWPAPAVVDEEAMKEFFKAHIGEQVSVAVAALPPAEKGKDADPVEVAARIAAEVERAVAALPVPKDGQSVTLDDMRPLIDEAVTKAVALIPVPKDGKDGRNGVDAVKFFRDDKGHLIVVKSDGSTDDLGEYVGKDGRDATLDAVEKLIAESVAKIAPPEIERDAYLAEFAPDDVASNVSLAVKMMAALPHAQHAEPRSETHPINVSVTMPEMKAADTTVNVSIPEQVPPNVTIEPAVVNVSPAHVTVEARRSKEVTTVTGYDKSGRIKSFEKTEVDE